MVYEFVQAAWTCDNCGKQFEYPVGQELPPEKCPFCESKFISEPVEKKGGPDPLEKYRRY